MRSFYFLLLIILCCGVPFCRAADLSPLQIAEKLQQTYDQTSAVSADFRQTTTIPMSRRRRKGAGTMVIQKPGFMRWDYTSPDKQVLTSDGKIIYMYFASSQQMIVMPAQDYLKSDITYAFFAGTGNIIRDFKVLPAENNTVEPRYFAIKLIPRKNHPQVSYLTVIIDRDTFLIKRLMIVDHFDSLTDIVLTNLSLNHPKPVDYFVFSPPPDTEIIRQ